MRVVLNLIDKNGLQTAATANQIVICQVSGKEECKVYLSQGLVLENIIKPCFNEIMQAMAITTTKKEQES